MLGSGRSVAPNYVFKSVNRDTHVLVKLWYPAGYLHQIVLQLRKCTFHATGGESNQYLPDQRVLGGRVVLEKINRLTHITIISFLVLHNHKTVLIPHTHLNFLPTYPFIDRLARSLQLWLVSNPDTLRLLLPWLLGLNALIFLTCTFLLYSTAKIITVYMLSKNYAQISEKNNCKHRNDKDKSFWVFFFAFYGQFIVYRSAHHFQFSHV